MHLLELIDIVLPSMSDDALPGCMRSKYLGGLQRRHSISNLVSKKPKATAFC